MVLFWFLSGVFGNGLLCHLSWLRCGLYTIVNNGFDKDEKDGACQSSCLVSWGGLVAKAGKTPPANANMSPFQRRKVDYWGGPRYHCLTGMVAEGRRSSSGDREVAKAAGAGDTGPAGGILGAVDCSLRWVVSAAKRWG